MKTILALLIFAAPAPAARATKPCGPDTWFARNDRPAAEWKEAAKWVVIGKVTARKEILRPFPNCHSADRSQCAMQGASVITVKAARWEKGVNAGKRLKLSAGFCAPEPPKKAGGTYRFYGREPGAYLFFEELAP